MSKCRKRLMSQAKEASSILFSSFLLARETQNSPMEGRKGSNTDTACLICSEIQDACCPMTNSKALRTLLHRTLD